MPKAIIVSAATQVDLEMLLIEAKIKVPLESGYVLADGVLLSAMGEQGGNVHASILIADGVAGADDMVAALGGAVNIANAPTRSFLGAPVPNAPTGPSDLQFRLALSEFKIRDAVESYVAASDQDTRDWYDRTPIFEQTDPRIVKAISDMKIPAEMVTTLFAFAMAVDVPK